ncbi:MAG: cohesin domain-containing protein [Candidatus Woesearchaeota archaeon]
MSKKKSQISFEFIIIFGIVFMVLTGFILIIKTKISEINEEKEYQEAISLINNIKTEILIASSVNNNYYRKFELPNKINGYEYNLILNNELLDLNLFEKFQSKSKERKIKKTYNTILPFYVKGGFSEKINETNKEHCITKNNIDGIRIAKNQISLDSKESNIYNKNYDLEVKKDDFFNIYVNLYCITNLRSVQLTIKYDPNILELVDYELMTKLNYPEENTLFEYADLLDMNGKGLTINNTFYKYIDPEQGRFTLSVIGKECVDASGNLAKIKFKAKEIPEKGLTKIDYEDLFNEEALKMYNCNFDAYSKEDLPKTKKNINIKII